MKICDLTQFYSPVSGGVKRYIAEKVAYLRQHGAPGDRHVLVVPGERTTLEEGERSRVYHIRSPLVSRTAQYRMLLNLRAVERILESERPDLIESNDPYQLAWKALASGRALGIPVVGFYHSHFAEANVRTAMKYFGQAVTEMMMEITRRYVRYVYNQCARTFVPSAPLAAVLREWGVENVSTVDLGVDAETFRPEENSAESDATRAALGLPARGTAVILLYVGRLSPEKNVTTLFDAFDQLRSGSQFSTLNSQSFPCHLLIVGDGQQRALLQALQARHPRAVTWQPYCADKHELARLYRAADLFVHPGVQETFGLVTLEAQACGTPVVGIRGSYMDRIVLGDLLVHWAEKNTPAALATAIAGLARRGPADLRALGLGTSAPVRKRYAWQHAFDRLFAAYRVTIATEAARRQRNRTA
ncbi:MAG: glycosyltransferase [Verrucomicrobia bacterium]|nr:glycosyltransferase [Verrucomicrobiota bacterium]